MMSAAYMILAGAAEIEFSDRKAPHSNVYLDPTNISANDSSVMAASVSTTLKFVPESTVTHGEHQRALFEQLFFVNEPHITASRPHSLVSTVVPYLAVVLLGLGSVSIFIVFSFVISFLVF